MTTSAYRLTFVLRLAGSDADTTQQTVTIAAETVDEAVEAAQSYRADLPTEAVISVTLADAAGDVIWSQTDTGTPGAAPQKDQP